MSMFTALPVRPARLDDVDSLVEFNAAMALETEGRVLDRLVLRRGVEAVLESPARGFYLVSDASSGPAPHVIGQLLVTYEWSDWRNGAFWWIQSVYVDPSWRRRGAYRSLYDHVLDEARSRSDVCGVRLYVDAANAGAQAAYKRVGLVCSGYRVFERDFILSTPHPDAACSRDQDDAHHGGTRR